MIQHTMVLDYPVDDVIELLCSEAFCLEASRAREEVVDARYAVLADDERTLRFQLGETTYKRTRTGGLDRSATEDSRVVYTLDRSARTLTWQYEGGESERVQVGGETRFHAEGEHRCRIERQVDIQVQIPIIGKGIEKLIEGEFRKGFETLERRIRRAMDAR